MVDLRTLVHKTSIDPEQLNVCLLNYEKRQTLDDISPVFSELTEGFGLLLAVDKLPFPNIQRNKWWKPSSLKMLVESNNFYCSGILWDDTENECSNFFACMNSRRKLKYQMPSAKTIKLPVLTEPGNEIQTDLFSKPHIKNTIHEPYILVGIDRYSERSVIRVCKSIPTREFVKFGKVY